MSPVWSATATPGTPGWIHVPNGVNAAETETWIAESIDDLRMLWDDRWRPEFEPVLRKVLEAARETRPEDALLDVLYWPYIRPLVARVAVRAGTSTALSSWADAGFRVDAYDGADIGPGLQCVASREFREGDSTATLVHTHHVFDDGQDSVVVTVEPTMEEVFAHMTPGLHGLIASLEVRRQDGTVFAARAVPGFTRSAADEWEISNDG